MSLTSAPGSKPSSAARWLTLPARERAGLLGIEWELQLDGPGWHGLSVANRCSTCQISATMRTLVGDASVRIPLQRLLVRVRAPPPDGRSRGRRRLPELREPREHAAHQPGRRSRRVRSERGPVGGRWWRVLRRQLRLRRQLTEGQPTLGDGDRHGSLSRADPSDRVPSASPTRERRAGAPGGDRTRVSPHGAREPRSPCCWPSCSAARRRASGSSARRDAPWR